MLQKIYFMVFERYIPELKKYDGILFLHQPMTSGQPLKIVQRHKAHPVCNMDLFSFEWHHFLDSAYKKKILGNPRIFFKEYAKLGLAIFVGQVISFDIYFSCKKADAVKYCS